MKRIFTITFMFAMSIISAMSQNNRIITGVVMDGELENEPLIGATVGVGDKKVQTGTVTDINGKFSISVPVDVQSLRVSYVGYESKVVSLQPGVDNYTITLSIAGESINEVVVTGYQNIDRRKLTAAVSEVKISDENLGAIKSIDEALAGQVAGVSSVSTSGAPGSPAKIRIRGTASINGVQEPLWVLDGMPLEGNDIPTMENLNDIDDIYQTSIAGLNPADIDNITVLKDAAATAIYGARAANGVIVITTKKGKEGRPIVSFSTKLTVTPKRSIDRLNLLNSNEKVGLELDLLRSEYTEMEKRGGVANILDELGEFDTYKAGGWEALSSTAQQRINNLRNINVDWNDLLFRTVFNQEYNASVSGGSERAHYYASLGYYNEKGTTKGVENNRYNMTLKADFKINKLLKLAASIFANQRRQEGYVTDTYGFTNPVYYSRRANPYFQPYDENGNYNYDRNIQGRDTNVFDFNIFEEYANSSKDRTDRSVIAKFDAELKLYKGLVLNSQFGYQYDNYDLDRYVGKNTYVMRYASQYSYKADGAPFLPDGGMMRKTNSHSKQWTWKTMLEWNKRYNEIHDVELMGGCELRHTESKSVTTTAYGYDPRTLTSQPVIIPASYSTPENLKQYNETFSENAYVSWFATGSYTLLHRYTFGSSVRWDGSDVFGVAKKYRYLPLYSFSGLWRMKEEKWLRDVNWIDELSLRASYGIQGNIDKNTSPYLIGTFDRTTVISSSNNAETIIDASTAPNPDLKWEKTKNVNLGVDLAFLRNRIRLTVDYYYRKGTDLISTRTLPLETGFSYTTINWASMKNTGWEFALNTRNIVTKDFTWTTTLNLGFNSNEIINETTRESDNQPSREGYPVGALFAYKTAGLDDNGYPLFVAKDGSIMSMTEFFRLNSAGASTLTAADQRDLYTYMGTSDPKCSGGFINHFEYKNWSLGINFIFNLGMKVRVQPSYNPAYFDRGMNTNHDILNRWSAENTNTNLMPLLVAPAAGSSEYNAYQHLTNYGETYGLLDTWIKSCNYWRLQSLRLAYRLPSNWLKQFGISSASVSLEGRNLMVFASNYDNYLDPETMGNPYAQPIAKSIIFGLNVNF